MKRSVSTNPNRLLYLTAILALVTLACNLSTTNPLPTPASGGGPSPEAVLPTSALTPTPDLPAGWVVFSTDTLRISLYHPAGWEATPSDSLHLDLHEVGGSGWVEVSLLDAANADDWGLVYTPAMEASALMEALIRAAREDGVFSDPVAIQTRGGSAGSISEGRYDIYNETVIIAAVGLADRAVLVVGHAGSDDADAPRLVALYRTLVWSISQN